MDPKVLNTADWQNIVAAVNFFWYFGAGLIVAALALALAQAAVPSLIGTGHLARNLGRLRPPLYTVFAIGIVLALVMAYQGVTLMHSILREYYPRWWM